MVLAWFGLRAQPNKRAEVLSAVDDLLRHMRDSPGCTRGRLLVDRDDPNSLTVESEWRSAEDTDRFVTTPEFQLFKGIRMLLRGEPFVMIDDIRTRTTGFIK